jgi:superfamily I DNA/RNA helicase
MPQFKFNTISRTDIQESVGGSQMIFAIDYDGPHHLLITGPPGSGKTTISLMRAERQILNGKKVLLVTYHDLLRRSLVNIASDELAPHVHKFFKWYFDRFGYLQKYHTEDDMLAAMNTWKGVDEIIVDEGQDLGARVYRSLIRKCSKLTVGADNAQKVHESGISSLKIQQELSSKGDDPVPVPLMYNYRNTYEIYNFARHFLPFNQIVNNKLSIEQITRDDGELPTIFLVPDENTRAAQLKILLTNAGDRNVAVLVYHVEEVDEFADLITSMGIKCSRHHKNDHIGNEIENVLVTTLKSAKGLEFQVVIMPNMETARDEWYKTEEHYFVACTRAKEDLFLIVKGSQLPDCLDNFNEDTYELRRVARQPHPPKIESKKDDVLDWENLPF